MLIKIDFDNNTPLYEQIYNEVVLAIVNDEIIAGEKLPSVRRLAQDLSINLHTVNKAYKKLRDDGYVSNNRTKGMVVSSNDKFTVTDIYIENLKDKLKPIIINAKARGLLLDDIFKIIKNIDVNLKEEK